MAWFSRFRKSPARGPSTRPPAPPGTTEAERAAPAIAALFEGLAEDGGHSLLDLGPAVASNFQLYSRFAGRIYFADLLGGGGGGRAPSTAWQLFLPEPGALFDIVLAWNLLDRLPPRARPHLVERLSRLTRDEARLYVLVDASGRSEAYPLRFALRGVDRVAHIVTGDPEPAFPQILPADIERLLRPFRVEHAYTLKSGFREYVAVKK